MLEHQPILRALIEQGYSSKMLGAVINEKTQRGTALIKLDSIEKPFNIYWNKHKSQWQDVKPAEEVSPAIVERYYASAI
jgi:hypothetical protein